MAIADANPAPELIYHHRVHLWASLRELLGARELVRTLAERELRARYKQASLGFAWAVITPVVLMLVFTVFVRRVAHVETNGVPYPLFSYLGLLPWTFFSSSLSQGGLSLVSNSSLLNKVYCPREVFPLAMVGVAAVDTTIATGVLGVLFAVYTTAPQPMALWVPVLLAIQLAFTLGATMAVSAIMVYFRDVRHALPLVLQLGLFATPVAWGIDAVVPVEWRSLYVTLNPLAAVIDGYRRTILYGLAPRPSLLIPATVSAAAYLTIGYIILKRLEPGFADVA